MYSRRVPKLLLLLFLTVLPLAVPGNGQETVEGELVVTKCWSFPVQLGKTVASMNGKIFLGTLDGRVEAVSPDGRKVWTSEFGGEIASNIVAMESQLFVATTATGGDGKSSSSLRILSFDTGITTLRIPLPAAGRHWLRMNQGTLVVVSDSGVIEAVDPQSGTVKWKREVAESFVGEPYFNSVRLLVASTSKQLFEIGLATGEMLSMRKMEFGVTAAGETSGGETVIGDQRGGLSLMDRRGTGVEWRFKTGGAISSIRTVNGNLLTGSHDNFVYFLTPRNGGLEWKRRIAGRVTHIGLIETSFALVSSLEEQSATFLSLSNGRIVGRISLDEGESLSADPIAAGDLIIVLTNQRAIAYSLSGCSTKKDGDPGKIAR